MKNRSFVLKVSNVVDPYQEIFLPEDVRHEIVSSLKEKVFFREPYYHDWSKAIAQLEDEESDLTNASGADETDADHRPRFN